MSSYNELDKFEKAAVHIVRIYSGMTHHNSDEDYYKHYIDSYHCEEERKEMAKQVDKLKKLAFRIEVANKFGLIGE